MIEQFNKILLQDISKVWGVGESKKLLLNKLDIYTIFDLLHYFPYNFIDFSKFYSIYENYKNKGGLTKVRVISKEWIGFRKKVLKVNVTDERSEGQLLFFGRDFYDSSINVGDYLYIYGKFEKTRFGNIYKISNFKLYTKHYIETYKFLPVYRLTKGLTSLALIKIIENGFKQFGKYLYNFIPEEITKKYNFPPYKLLIYKLHFPSSLKEHENSKKFYAYIEFFIYMSQVYIEKRWKVDKNSDRYLAISQYINNLKNNKTLDFGLQKRFLDLFEFELTEDQKSVLKELNGEFRGKYLINRLIQGDVGSGKTVVAMAFALNYIELGYQVAFMAPTEVLSFQHYINFHKKLEKLGIKSAYLSASLTRKQKEKVFTKIENFEVSFVFGTHSLIQKDVNFKNLKLIIIDEQQKFGVNQRLALRNKGNLVDLIVLSATPIPRSFSLTLYGDLDISTINHRPAIRKKVKTLFIPDSQWDKILNIVKQELKKGFSGFFVYPAVEEDNALELKSAKLMYDKLVKQLPDYKVGLCHGKMKDKEIAQIMDKFKKKEIDVLVTTTIIGVGIDIPHATFMVIEEADRYGLSTLHQLRGRIGRGEYPGICILSVKKHVSDIAYKRIKKILETDDGFDIAQFDFELRGPGEIFGIKQSGDVDFKLANFYEDQKLFKLAANDAKKIIDADPDLSKKYNLNLKKYLITFKNLNTQFLLSG